MKCNRCNGVNLGSWGKNKHGNKIWRCKDCNRYFTEASKPASPIKDHKRCNKCGIIKPFDEFYLSQGRLRSYCKSCFNYISHNRENSYRYARYGITKTEYLVMLNNQNGLCCICKKLITKIPHIDHNHTTGEVRGVLCSSCNTAIGLLGEDIEVMLSAIDYLHK